MPEQTLAQMVRAKHPGAYDDLSDQQLEAAVAKKYPGAYDDVPRTPNTAAPPPAAAATPAPPPSAPPTRAPEGMASALLPSMVATGASMAVAKAPLLSIGAAAAGGAAGEGLRRMIRIGQDTIPEGPGLAAVKRLGGEALEIPGAMLREAGVQGAAEAVGGAVTKGVGALGTAVYRGYLKPSLSMVDLPKAREIVATGIREMLPITKAGEERAKKLIGQINNQVTAMLSSAKGGRVDLKAVADRVRAYAKKQYYKPGVDEADYRAAMEVADTIDNHPALIGPGGAKTVKVNPADANEIKRSVRPNSRAYGQQGSAPEAATRKAAGHEFRTALETIEPKIGPLNDRERKLIDALDAVKHAAGREENRSALFGVPTLVAGGVTGGLASRGDVDSSDALIGGLVARGLLTPAVASRAAFLTARFARVPGTTAAMAVRMAAVLALRDSEAPKTGNPAGRPRE